MLGEDVLITGAGPIGAMAAAVVRHAGARHIVVVEPNGFRRDLALRMGASRAVDPRETDLKTVMADLDMKEGFDIALEISGDPNALRVAVPSCVTVAGSPCWGCCPAMRPSTGGPSFSTC